MYLKVVVFHKGALAHYNVGKTMDNAFVALLIRYDGKPINTPARHLTLRKEDHHWVSDSANRHLPAEIGKVIDKKWQDHPVFNSTGIASDQ